MAGARGRVVSLVLLACLAACALLPTERILPLAEYDCLQALPLGYEVRATLRATPASQNFLLALGTAPERIDLALLTAQGMPVYRLSCSEGGPRASVQTPVGDDLPPLALLNYLSLIFMDSEVLARHLRPDWMLQEQSATRVLTRPAGEGEIRISYQGPAPWFGHIELADSLNGVNLRLLILESSRVLSE